MEYTRNDIIEYIVALIAEFGKHFSLTQRQAYRYISRHGGICFVERHYGVMHTLSFRDAVESLTNYCQRQGGLLK